MTAGPNNVGILQGPGQGVSNNTEWGLTPGPYASKEAEFIAIPFQAKSDSVSELYCYMRNNAGINTAYTVGDGGTHRVLLVGDNNGEPDMSNILWTGPETVGDATQFSGESDFLNSYPGATWIPNNTSSLSAQPHQVGGVSVMPGALYWMALQQVRGGGSNHSSVNFFRSGQSGDFAVNMLRRTQDPGAIDNILPQVRNSGSWRELDRHQIFSVVYSDGTASGQHFYNSGSADDDEPGNDRFSNVNGGGDSVRNTYNFSGTKKIRQIHLCAVRNLGSGSGNIIYKIDGATVATIPSSDFPQSATETYPTSFEPARWVSRLIDPVTVTNSCVIEITATGSADIEIAAVVGEAYFPVSSDFIDMSSEYRLNNGSWQESASGGRLLYDIPFNELADGTPGFTLEDQYPLLVPEALPDIQLTFPVDTITTIAELEDFTVTWVDNEPPASGVRNYDPHAGDVDLGSSVALPATSKVVDLSSFVTGTSGTIDLNLEYFDDGNGSGVRVVDTRQVTYNIVDNQAPVATGEAVIVDENSSVTFTLDANDPDADPIASWDVFSDPSNGTITGTGPEFTYMPNPDFHGSDSFEFTATDDQGNVSQPAIVAVTVNEVILPVGKHPTTRDGEQFINGNRITIGVSVDGQLIIVKST